MKLIIFNGSPRKEKSSTKILFDHFLKGFSSIDGNTFDYYYLRAVQNRKMHIRAFKGADCIIIGFPLYADSMPSFVKEFIESLDVYHHKLNNLSIGYLVQSGFPEANHSRPVEQYLKKLTSRLGSKYLGTIIKGNANRIDKQPGFFVKRLFKSLYRLGSSFGQTGTFDDAILAELALPEKLKGFSLILNRWILKTRLATKNWDKQLKDNGVFENRFDAPFLKS